MKLPPNYKYFSSIVMITPFPLKIKYLGIEELGNFALPRKYWLLVIQCMSLEKQNARAEN